MRPYLRNLCLLVLASGALLLGESAATAQYYYGPEYGPPPPPPPRYRPAPRYEPAPAYYYAPFSHLGFFARVTIGPGYLHASEDFGGATRVYSGFGLTLNGALGLAIAPNLIIFGEVLSTTALNADETDSGQSVGLSGLDVTLYGFGPGIAYYLEPANVYLSATLAFSKVSFSDHYSQDPVDDTDIGFGGSFSVGKEWWVARHLGLGIAGQIYLATMTEPYYNARMGAVAASLLFSATLN